MVAACCTITNSSVRTSEPVGTRDVERIRTCRSCGCRFMSFEYVKSTSVQRLPEFEVIVQDKLRRVVKAVGAWLAMSGSMGDAVLALYGLARVVKEVGDGKARDQRSVFERELDQCRTKDM